MKTSNIFVKALANYIRECKHTRTGSKGEDYAVSRRILSLDEEDDGETITALVQGTRRSPYETNLFFDDGDLDTDCSCPVGYDCKHAYAAVLTVLYGAWCAGSLIDRDASSLFPSSWMSGKNTPDPSLFDDIQFVFSPDDTAEKNLTPRGASRLSEWWKKYLSAKDKRERMEILESSIRARLAGVKRDTWVPFYQFENILNCENPVEVLENLEDAIQKVAQYYDLNVHPADPRLQEFIRSEEVQRFKKEFDQEIATADLLRWLAPREVMDSSLKAGSLDLVWTTQIHKSGIPLICFQLLLTAKKLNRKPRCARDIELLRRDVATGSRQFTGIEERLIKWLADRTEMTNKGYSTSYHSEGESTLFPVHDVMMWINLWGSKGMIAWSEGGKVEFDPHPARLVLAREENKSLRWIVEMPSGNESPPRRMPLPEAGILAESPSDRMQDNEARVYVRQGDVLFRLETGGMPFHVFAGVSRMREYPVEKLGDAGETLLERLGMIGRESQDHGIVSHIPVQPVIELRLDVDNMISVSSRALSPTGQEFIRNHMGKWVRQMNPVKAQTADPAQLEIISESQDSERAEDVAGASQPDSPSARPLFIMPRPEDLLPAEEWLDQIIPPNATFMRGGDGRITAQWKVPQKSLKMWPFLWLKRPPRVRFLGNRDFKNLVTIRPKPSWCLKIDTSGMDWLRVSLKMEEELKSMTVKDLDDILAREKEDLISLPCARVYRRQDIVEYRDALATLYDLGMDVEEGEQRIHVLQLASSQGRKILEREDQCEALQALARKARCLIESFQGIPRALLEASVTAKLRPYQHTGVDFLVWACRSFGGCILADDMGLGKTIQALAALTALRSGKKVVPPSLVICPASVAHNWQRECSRFTPMLRTVVVERGTARKKIYEQLKDYDLVVLNYSLARRDVGILAKEPWFLICVDEAQMIKNPAAHISKTVKQLRGQYCVALTGTPIENRLLDLWSIVDFTAPGFLPSLGRFTKRLKAEEDALFYRMLRCRLRPLLLRRMKSEVEPELPPRVEERIDCEMTAQQRSIYLAEVKKTRLLLGEAKSSNLAGKERIQMLAALTRLRQICCDPSLLGFEENQSGKILAMMERVDTLIEAGHKVLVFSQFVQMLNRLRKHLLEKSVPLYMLTGQTQNRKHLVDMFESDPAASVFLISLKAGGLGLNLVSASHVILFDPWWNPAVEAQAIDRTHRIGQDKTVVAYRLITLGTVEEGIVALQEKKRSLVKNILEEEAFNRCLTKEDFAFLLDRGVE